MKTLHRLIVLAGIVAASAAAALAQDSAARSTGRVLVLDNERIFVGDVSREGDMYVIRRPVGEVKIPAFKALKVCGSLEEAFQFLSSRANLRDADERLRLARWCQAQGMLPQAIAEVKASLQMRPGHAESKQFLAVLERAAASPEPASPPAPEPPSAAAEALPVLEVSSECLALFTTKVQPILMNTCASCHAGGRGGSFVLTRSSDASARRATQLNLSAALRHVCFDQPSSSPLLFKACCAHGGGAQPPLAGHQATPFVTLQGWVEMVAVHNPHLRPHGTALAKGSPAPPALEPAAQKTPTGPEPVGTVPAKEVPTARAVESYPSGVPVAAVDSAPRPQPIQPAGTVQSVNAFDPRLVQALPGAAGVLAADAFDPVLFNQAAHPKR